MWWLTGVGLLALVTALAGCGSAPPREEPGATVAVQAANGIDPEVHLRPDVTEVGPGGRVTWEVTATVPADEAERAEQVSIEFVPGLPLVVLSATGPDFIPNLARSYVLERLDDTFTHRLRKVAPQVEVQGATPQAVTVYLGDLDPGQTVGCTIVTEWPGT